MRKPTLIFIHGGPGLDCSYFKPYFSDLSDRINLHFYTQSPVYGGNSRYDSPLDALACELAKEISKFTPPVYLLAHSFGAVVALEFLRQNPTQICNGLVLVSWVYDRETQWLFEVGDKKHLSLVTDPLESGAEYKDKMKTYARKYFSENELDEGLQILDRIDYKPEIFNMIWSETKLNFDLKPTLAKLCIPVLSILGENDQVVSQDYIEIGTQLIADCRSHRLPMAGHFPFIGQTEECRRLIINFIV